MKQETSPILTLSTIIQRILYAVREYASNSLLHRQSV